MIALRTQPPILKGTSENQLKQIRSYLYQISRELEIGLQGTAEQSVQAYISKQYGPGASAALPPGTIEAMNQQAGQLKSLIIKTANTVKAYSDSIVANLSSHYVAESDFGTFSESITQTITAMQGYVNQAITDVSAVNDFMVKTDGYIRQGIIGYNGATPIIGIAIGQEIVTTGTATVDGKEYPIIDTTKNMSIWTPAKLSFYVNGEEQAYVSNGAFYVKNLVVTERFLMGEHQWQITADPVFGLIKQWIGD